MVAGTGVVKENGRQRNGRSDHLSKINATAVKTKEARIWADLVVTVNR